jgi:hypothetical protein
MRPTKTVKMLLRSSSIRKKQTDPHLPFLFAHFRIPTMALTSPIGIPVAHSRAREICVAGREHSAAPSER